jgi:hypothetical protein
MDKFSDIPEGMTVDIAPDQPLAFSDVPEGMTIERPAQQVAPAPAQQPVQFSGVPEGMTIEAVRPAAQVTPASEAAPAVTPQPVDNWPADKPRPGFWKRLANSLYVGGVDYVANLAGSTIMGVNAESGRLAQLERAKKLNVDPRMMGVNPDKTPSQAMSETRAAIKDRLVKDEWRATFEKETGRQIPVPWDDPIGFLDKALNMAAQNAGNVVAARAGKSITGAVVAGAAMADQEAAGFADNWSAAGIPIDFVAPYAKTYGLISAPVEYFQNIAYSGKGIAGKIVGGVAKEALARMGKNAAVKGLLKVLDIGLEGGEEAGQTAIEYRVAKRMVERWNAEHPDKAVVMPDLTSSELKQAALGGAAVGAVFEGMRGAGALSKLAAKRTAEFRAAAAQRNAAANILEGAAEAAQQPAQAPVAPPPLPDQAPPVAPPQVPAQPALAAPAPSVKAERIEAPIAPVQINPDDAAQIQTVAQNGAVVNDFPMDRINFDPERFQYKLNPGESGQTGSLAGVKKYDKMLGGVLSVWYDADKGRVFVVNGHNRASKARELGETAHAVRFIDAQNAQEARAAGALMNIAEGNGTAIDAAKFFRDSKFTRQQIEERGLPMSGAVVRDGSALAALSPTIFDRVVQGVIPKPVGVAIGASGLTEPQQIALTGLMERSGKKLDAKALAELAEEVKDAPTVTKDEGPMLFNLTAREENLAVEKARISAAINKRLTADKNLFAKVSTKKAAGKLQAAGNQIDVEANRAISEDAAVIKEVFNTLKKTADMAAILNAAAEEVYRGGRQTKAIDKAYASIREAVSGAIGRRAGDSLARVQPGAEAGNPDTPGSLGQAEGQTPAAAAAAPVAQPAAGQGAGGVELFPGADLGFELRGQEQPAGQTFQEQQAAAEAKAIQDRQQGGLPGMTVAGYGGSAAGRGGTIADGPRIDRLGAMDVATDDPAYTRLPVGLTDGVRFLKQLGASIRLSTERGKWAGMFRGQSNGAGRPGPMEILMRHELFQLVSDKRKLEIRAAANAEAEAHPLADAMTPEAKRDLADSIFAENVGRERLAAMKRGAPEALAVIWHEIGHMIDYFPNATLERGNLLGHMKAVRNYQQSMIESIRARGALLEKNDRAKIQREAARRAGPQPKNPADVQAWRDRRAAEYRAGIQAEADRRGLVTLDTIDQESRNLIAWWNGKPEMPAYFRSATERYAEVFSVLANNPRAVEQKAPRFWKAWNEFLVLRPEAGRAWDQLQVEVANGAGAKATEAELRQMVANGDRNQFEAFLRNRTNRFRATWDMILYNVLRTQAPIDWMLMKADDAEMKKRGVNLVRRMAPGSPLLVAAAEATGTANVTEALDNWRYATSKAEPYYQDMTRVIGGLQDNGLVNEFRLYMMLRHVSENRQDVASVKGVDPARALEILKDMRARSPETMAKLDQAHEDWYAVRRKHMINLVEQMGMFNQGQLDVLKRRESYVTFLPDFGAIADDDPKGLLREMEKSFGREASGTLGFQRGWLGDIHDSIAATIQKDRKLIRAAMRNEAAKRLGLWLMKQQADNPTGRPVIIEAKSIWDGGKKRTIQVGEGNRLLGDLMWMENGELKHYYVPKAFADFLNGAPQGHVMQFVNLASTYLLNPVKRAFVEWAPGAWAVLGLKDLHAYTVQTPGVNSIPKLRAIGPAFQAARSIARGEPNSLAKSAQERMMLGSRLERGDDWSPNESALQRELDQFGRKVTLSEAATVADRKNFFREYGRRYMDWANRNNRIWAETLKIAGMSHLDQQLPNMPEWKKREIVRVMAGNPDFWHRSGAASLLDWNQLYYNASKEGRLASIKTLRENPRDYLVNTMIWTAAPAALMGMLAGGLLSKALKGMMRPEEEDEIREYEEMMKWIPSYEKQRNNVIPLYWADRVNKRVVYARLPVSEGQQWAHGLTYSALANGGSDIDFRAMIQGTGMMDMQPGNPLMSIAGSFLDFWRGRNPYDVYRGTTILTDDEMAAGGRAAYSKLAKFAYNSTLSAMLGRIPSEGTYAPERTRLEKIVQTPVIGGILGRWVRVSSGFDEEAKLIGEKVERPKALARLAVQRAVKDYISTGSWGTNLADVVKDPYAAGYMQRYVKEYTLRQALPPEVERMVFAPSREFRAEAAARMSIPR